FELVVLIDDLDRQATELAAEVIEPELEGIAHVIADRGRRAAKCADDADLDCLLPCPGRSGHEREHGCRGHACPGHLRFFPPVGAILSARISAILRLSSVSRNRPILALADPPNQAAAPGPNVAPIRLSLAGIPGFGTMGTAAGFQSE